MTVHHRHLLMFIHFILINKAYKAYQNTTLVLQNQTRWVWYIELELNLTQIWSIFCLLPDSCLVFWLAWIFCFSLVLVWMTLCNIFSPVLRVRNLLTAQLELILSCSCLFAYTDPFELVIIITRHFRYILMFRCDLLTTQLFVCADIMLTTLKLSWTFRVEGTFLKNVLRPKKMQFMQHPLYANVCLCLSSPPPKRKIILFKC